MLSYVFITGDNHGTFTRYYNIDKQYWNENTGIIILGDFSINFYLNKTDQRKKKELMQNYPFYFYILRGNHEERPQNLPNIETIFDENVKGSVYYEPEFPRIRYFMDYGFYQIKGYSCLIIGGAYSVDKTWRLMRAGNLTEETNIPKKSGWFNDEQLTKEEMADCLQKVKLFHTTGKVVDFVFTHTCPYSYQPRDMFLSFIDQSTVDNSMEFWLDKVKDSVNWGIWCFGHYHADRIERPHVEQYYNDIEEIDDIWNRWEEYDKTHELPWHLVKGPNFDL